MICTYDQVVLICDTDGEGTLHIDLRRESLREGDNLKNMDVDGKNNTKMDLQEVG